MKILNFNVCKEDLIRKLEELNWGEEKGANNKHYATLQIAIKDKETLYYGAPYDCDMFQKQTKEERERNMPPNIIAMGRTLELDKAYWKQKNEFADKAKKYNSNNNNYNF